ncbi:DUF7453 family protein [Pelagicoccus mobilis]|uniref:Uncharacterized protein n=1 Tax=Pelagicoccus mobilis TaxID=415221 RepID=A0A934VR91_9BACT|nr:hypothetical protein [Pelagicoccus mobilis]MBK1877685.1 hypothetical protein [Pelagicoccus mobilis]
MPILLASCIRAKLRRLPLMVLASAAALTAAPGDLKLETLTQKNDAASGPGSREITRFESPTFPIAIDEFGTVSFAARVDVRGTEEFGFYRSALPGSVSTLFQSDQVVPGVTQNGDALEASASPRRGFSSDFSGTFHALTVVDPLGGGFLFKTTDGTISQTPITWPVDISQTRNFKDAVDISDGRGTTKTRSAGISEDILVSPSGTLYWKVFDGILKASTSDDLSAVMFDGTAAPGFEDSDNATFDTPIALRGVDDLDNVVFHTRVTKNSGARHAVFRYEASNESIVPLFVDTETTLPDLDGGSPEVEPEDVVVLPDGTVVLRVKLSSSRSGFWRIGLDNSIEKIAEFNDNGFFPNQTDEGELHFRNVPLGDWAVTHNGTLFFTSDLRSGASNTTSEGVWRIDPETKAITTLARVPFTRDVDAPSIDPTDVPSSDADFRSFDNLTAAGDDKVAFTAELSDGTGGLFATDLNGGLIKIALEGDPLEGSAIQNITFTPDLAGEEIILNKGTSGLNSNGELAFLADLADGGTALVKASYEGIVHPIGNIYIWDGGAGDTNWHTVVNGRSNWTDSVGTPWDEPPPANGTSIIKIGDEFIVELQDEAAHVAQVELGDSILELGAEFDCATTFEGSDGSSLILRKGNIKGGTLHTKGIIAKEGPDNAWFVWNKATIEEADLMIEEGHLHWWTNLVLIDASIVVDGGGLEAGGKLQFEGDSGLDLIASPEAVEFYDTVELVLGTDVTFQLNPETQLEIGEADSFGNIAIRKLDPDLPLVRTLQLQGQGKVFVYDDLQLAPGLTLINKIGTLASPGLIFDTWLDVLSEYVSNIEGRFENRGGMKIVSGGVAGEFHNFSQLSITNHTNNKPSILLECVNHGTLLQDGGISTKHFIAKAGSEHLFSSSTPQEALLTFVADEDSPTLVFEKGSSIKAQSGSSKLVFKGNQAPNLQAEIDVNKNSKIRIQKANTGPKETITIYDEGELTFEDLRFEKLTLQGNGSVQLTGEITPQSSNARMRIGTGDFVADGAVLYGIDLDELVVPEDEDFSDPDEETFWGEEDVPYLLKPFDKIQQRATFRETAIARGNLVHASEQTTVTTRGENRLYGQLRIEGECEVHGNLLAPDKLFKPTGLSLVFKGNSEGFFISNSGNLTLYSGDESTQIDTLLTVGFSSKITVAGLSHVIINRIRFDHLDDIGSVEHKHLGGEWVISDFAACEIRDERYSEGLKTINGAASLTLGLPHESLPSFVDLPTRIGDFSLKGKLTLIAADLDIHGDLNIEGGKLILNNSTVNLNTHFLRNAGSIKKNGTSKIIGEVESLRDQVQGIPTLAGNINIEGSLTTDGIIALGASPGSGLITGDLNLLPESEMRVEFAGDEAGTGFDFLEVGGTANLDGKLTLSLIDDYLPEADQTFRFIQAGEVDGTFATIEQGLMGRSRRMDVTTDAEGLLATAREISIESYQDWRTHFFNETDAADDLISGPTADPDGDGTSNLLEYLSNNLPQHPSSPPFSRLEASQSDYRIRLSNTVNDYQAILETSIDLQDWQPAQITESNDTVNGDTTLKEIRVSDPESKQRFYRLTLQPASP